MSCKCVECGEPVNDCKEQYCFACLIKWCREAPDGGRNLKAGGRFYGENLLNTNNVRVNTKDG